MPFFTYHAPDVYLVLFKVYDRKGNLTELIDAYVPRLRTKWRAICSFLRACAASEVREVQIKRGRLRFSLVACDGSIRWRMPIVADLRGIV